jgi:hypothetical protein
MKSADSVGIIGGKSRMLINSNDYFQVLENIKTQIKNAQYRAILGVNREQIVMCWGIGNATIENSSWFK